MARMTRGWLLPGSSCSSRALWALPPWGPVLALHPREDNHEQNTSTEASALSGPSRAKGKGATPMRFRVIDGSLRTFSCPFTASTSTGVQFAHEATSLQSGQ